jgi:hypothetical protein
VFRLSRNERSHWSGNGVHVEPESVFMIGRNMHTQRELEQPFEHQGGLDGSVTIVETPPSAQCCSLKRSRIAIYRKAGL